MRWGKALPEPENPVPWDERGRCSAEVSQQTLHPCPLQGATLGLSKYLTATAETSQCACVVFKCWHVFTSSRMSSSKRSFSLKCIYRLAEEKAPWIIYQTWCFLTPSPQWIKQDLNRARHYSSAPPKILQSFAQTGYVRKEIVRDHLVSHCLFLLALLFVCATHVVFYIWVCILRRCFSCPVFFNVWNVCTQNRNGLGRGVDG